MKKVILSLMVAGLCSTLSFGQTKTSEYTANLDGYNYVGDWADCIGPRSVGGGQTGKADVLGYSDPEGALTITTVGGQGGYTRSATYIPMIDKSAVTYSPGPVCTGAVMPGLDISTLPAAKQVLKVIVKASPAMTAGTFLRLYVGQGQNGGTLCSNNNTGSIGVTVSGTGYDTVSVDLSVAGNRLSNGPCAVGGNVPLNALTYIGFNPDFENGNYAGTLYIKQIILGNTTFKTASATATTAAINNSLISVYPNPAKDQISVDLTSLNTTDASVKIMNANGFVVYEAKASNAVESINTSSFNKGMYMVQVSSGDKVSNKKIVIE